MDKFKSIDTTAIHAGVNNDPTTGAIVPPINLATTFERDPDGEYSRGYIYTRSENPNRDALEQALAALEGADGAIAFGSGMAAVFNILMTLRPGDHVVFPDDAYYQCRVILNDVLGPWGLTHSLADMSRIDKLEAAVRPETKLIWLETPSNPLLKIVDIQAAASLAKAAGALIVCDNTWGSPVLQNPLELGADAVMHSTTKYLAGHHDVLGGAVILNQACPLYDKLRTMQRLGGAVPSPFDCWLTMRGLQTLPLRVRAQAKAAAALAEFLNNRPEVDRVFYPGLADHPNHQIAARQMKDFGGMLSFLVKGGKKEALAVAAGLKLITRATSLGGAHTLLEHRASLEDANTPTPQNLLRMSIGLEAIEDLQADLDQALKAIR